jgi:hypothetical protein
LLDSIDSIQRRAVRLINNGTLTSGLQSMEHIRQVGSLSLFYRYYHGHCSTELSQLIPPAPIHHRHTRGTLSEHPYTVDICRLRTGSFSSSFLNTTGRLWNSLPASMFPPTYNLNLFKKRINIHLQSPRHLHGHHTSFPHTASSRPG